MKSPVKKTVLGIDLSAGSPGNILEYVISLAQKKAEKTFIVTPNPEMVVASHKDKELKELLNSADLALCDGIGLEIAAHLLGETQIERITGVDFMKSLCENIAEKPINIGFLGGREKVAEDTAECLQKMYPGLRVVFIAQEWSTKGFVDLQQKSNKQVRQAVTKNEIDILFVAFGFPKQERWIAQNLDKIPVTVAMGVGGAFDYLSGRVSRAPFFLRAIGLEWLYRLFRQPWRFRRQLALIEFIFLTFRSVLRKKTSR